LDRTHIIGILRSLEMIKEELLIVGNFRSGNISRKRSNNVSNYTITTIIRASKNRYNFTICNG